MLNTTTTAAPVVSNALGLTLAIIAISIFIVAIFFCHRWGAAGARHPIKVVLPVMLSISLLCIAVLVAIAASMGKYWIYICIGLIVCFNSFFIVFLLVLFFLGHPCCRDEGPTPNPPPAPPLICDSFDAAGGTILMSISPGRKRKG